MGRRLGSLAPFFPFSFSFGGVRHSEDTEKGAGMGLPVGLFLFQLEGSPCLCTGGSGHWMQRLAAVSVLRGSYLVPLFSSPLPLPGFVYDVPGVLASGSGLAASA